MLYETFLFFFGGGGACLGVVHVFRNVVEQTTRTFKKLF